MHASRVPAFHRRPRLATALISWGCLTLGFLPPAIGAQIGPSIEMDPAIECWFHSEFPMLEAAIEPVAEVARSRLYFRCSDYPDFYFVDLAPQNGRFVGVGPQAEASCPSVHYYVEAVSKDFESTRTIERVVDVTSSTACQRRHPGAAFFPTDSPGIVLGSTTASATPLAPGFKSLGITGFLSSSGAVASAGGGSSTAVLIGVGAAAAAGAGLGILGGSPDATPPSPAAPGPGTGSGPTTPTTPLPTPPPTNPGPLRACFEIEPDTTPILAGQTIRLDGRCSTGGLSLAAAEGLIYEWDLGDGRTRDQPFVTTVYQKPGDYDVVLTVSRERDGQVERSSTSQPVAIEDPTPPPQACFQVRENFADGESCFAEFDASCSVGDISEYEWVLDANNEMGFGPLQRSGVVTSHDWGSVCGQVPAMTVSLTVSGTNGSDKTSQRVTILLQRDPNASLRDTLDLRVELEPTVLGSVGLSIDAGAGAQTILNPQASVSLTGRPGRVPIEIHLARQTQPFLIEIDLARSRYLVPGSWRALGGSYAVSGPSRIVIRHSGNPSERVLLEAEIRN